MLSIGLCCVFGPDCLKIVHKFMPSSHQCMYMMTQAYPDSAHSSRLPVSFHSFAASTCILQVFPKLYLPVMTENNLRVLKPWRAYIPSLSQLQHKAKVRQLNSYIKRLLHQRWAARHRNGSSAGNSQDVLERIMQALQVNDSLHVDLHVHHVC